MSVHDRKPLTPEQLDELEKKWKRTLDEDFSTKESRDRAKGKKVTPVKL